MNSSTFINSSVFVQNSTMTIVESWFIPLDIFMILCCSWDIIVNIFALSIIILDKTCHTVPMMLITNSYLCGLIAGCSTLSLCVFTFENDFKRIQYQDSLCTLRGYIIYVAGALFNYSFLLQALYRYFLVIYPTNLFFQSFRFQILTICSTWIFSFVYPLVILLDGQIVYNVDNQICDFPSSFFLFAIYAACCVYIIPVSLTMFIYWKLIRHVRQMGRNLATGNNLIRAKRELKMVRRIVILTTILASVCFPYFFMMFLRFFNHPVKYKYRISYLFVDVSGLTTVIILFQFTDSLKESAMKRIKWRRNRIMPRST
jgi:hypothetical protein